MALSNDASSVPPLDRRLQLLLGKGGVGRSTLSAALGLYLSGRGRRVLLCEMRSQRALPPLFGREASSPGPVALAPGIDWMGLSPGLALSTYAGLRLRFRAVARAVFESPRVRHFLAAVPALAEILMLGHLCHLAEQGPAEAVILDAPSTGPALLMLESPRTILQTAPAGPLRDGARWIHEWLSDPRRTALHRVTLAEELPVSESLELDERLRRAELPDGLWLLNRLLPEDLDAPAEAALARLASAPDDPARQALAYFRERLSRQRRELARLRPAEGRSRSFGEQPADCIRALAPHFAGGAPP
jgi:anion-transporting  ArsA/GET3 family ATPase